MCLKRMYRMMMRVYSIRSAQAELSESEIRKIEIDVEEILQNVDLSGTTDWNSTEQQEAYNLICEYACIFLWNDLDLGKTWNS